MSTDGRAQDVLYDMLDHYDLTDHEKNEIAENVIDVIGGIYMEYGERVAKARLLAEMTEHGIKMGNET